MAVHFSRRDDDKDDEGQSYDLDDEAQDQDEYGEEDEGPSQDEEDQDEPFERGQHVLANADPDVVDAHRDLLAAVLSYLDNEEEDLLRVAHRAGVDSLNPDEMSHEDLARLTYELSENYPEAMDAVTNRFPRAEGFLSTVLHGESPPSYE